MKKILLTISMVVSVACMTSKSYAGMYEPFNDNVGYSYYVQNSSNNPYAGVTTVSYSNSVINRVGDYEDYSDKWSDYNQRAMYEVMMFEADKPYFDVLDQDPLNNGGGTTEGNSTGVIPLSFPHLFFAFMFASYILLIFYRSKKNSAQHK